jgi:soluble lytic murein transglycosylase
VSWERRRRDSRARIVRRRTVAAIGTLLLLAIVVLAIKPLNHAVNQITLPLHHADIIRQQGHEKRLDPALIAGVIFVESKFQDRTSDAGATGLMQLLPATAQFIARRSHGTAFELADLARPQINIGYGTYYLRYLLDRYGGNKVLAVAAYNGGETNVDQWRADAQTQGHDFGVADIPFPETRAYVSRVLDAQRRYRATYPSELGY